MRTIRTIPTNEGRITIQENSAGIPEIKVRHLDKTIKIACAYEDISSVEEVVETLLSSTRKTKNTYTYGSTFTIRFDASHPAIQSFMNIKDSSYMQHPDELQQLVKMLNDKYETLCTIDFRYTVFDEQYEIMGVLSNYEDAISVCLDVYNYLQSFSYSYIHSLGVGTVFLPEEIDTLESREVLHRILGHGVSSAFQVFKREDVQTNNQSYVFYSYHYDFTKFNQSIGNLQAHYKELKKELRVLQQKDEGTQRHTYYPGHVFSTRR
ncbi:hypothetical protein CN918_31360 [Priestia megaterium]|nr:hypothetical protein CN918_31360 [Priestia megaterium]